MICSICKRTKEIEYASPENQYCLDCWSVLSSSYDFLSDQGREYLLRNPQIQE
ncbi:hypothetical protein [Bacillus sp. CECT 9360]|uniref:hypothetical protein n=1 Tax=Bacillus sp. CECT 9360 TaxID=2845821 RepID=UPI001E43854D|nr:hypothetical protein [Bacillus sp. CECT 9360]CAH0347460.1 hypothetical protein BCI9360_03860 [Bacillus sp. CECT 9360]